MSNNKTASSAAIPEESFSPKLNLEKIPVNALLFEEMGKELQEISYEVDFHYLMFELSAKLSLLKHTLVNGTEELRKDEITGMALLAGEIQEMVLKTWDFCTKGGDFFSSLNEPDVLTVLKRGLNAK